MSDNPTLAGRARLRPASSPAAAPQGAVSRRDETIAGFRIVHQLGEGGMGTVFLAEQREPVERVVALKLMRSSLTGNLALARFSAERQALARLTHPNIAAMYEAGATPDGFPFFAMEYVKGSTLTSYCDERRLTIRERLELFMQICDGVQHAHQRGVIHRDLKPSNLLVAEVEGTAVPKIIDFGIAKAVDRPLTEATLWTGDGIIGTPAYMSPEALNASGDDLDTRTDVYSLGVMLFELLAGVRARVTEGVALAALMRQAAESDLPTLTARFRSLDDGSRQQIARSRQLDAATLERGFRGDLTWIVARATAREREQRYPSAAELRADIERHLNHEPVLAGAPTLLYRTRKFIRRHRALAFASLAVLVTIVAGVVATASEYVRAQRARSEAEAVSLFLFELIEGANPWNRNKETTVREFLDEAAVRLPGQLADFPAARAELLLNIGTTQFHLGRSDRAEPLLRESMRLRKEVYGPDSPLVARAQNVLALVRHERGDSREAEALLRESLVIREKAYGHEHPSVARGSFDLGCVLRDVGRTEEAEKLCRESYELRKRLLARKDVDTTPDTVAMTLAGLASTVAANGRVAEAEAAYREALRIRESSGTQGYAYAKTQLQLGELLSRNGRPADALAVEEDALARLSKFVDATDLRVCAAQQQLATTMFRLGRKNDAERLLRTAYANAGKSHDTPQAVARSVADIEKSARGMGIVVTE